MTDLVPSRVKPVHRPPLSEKESARVARHRDEIEVARLQSQLDALEQDIQAARATARRASRPALELGGGRPRPAAAVHGERVRLPDGHEILVRPVEPADAPLLKEGLEHLGAVSRFRRFLGAPAQLGAHEIRLLTDVDHEHHEAYVAIDPQSGDGVGIARYVCDEDDETSADAAIVVLDSWQHRGVGEALADRLGAAAIARGVTHATGRMLVGNHAAERLLLRMGDPVECLRGPGTVRLTVRLRPGKPGGRPAIEIEGLVVARGGREVLHGIDLRVAPGSVTGLLGPSGCGKTTLLRAIVGVQEVAAGRVAVLGAPAGSAALRARIGYVTQAPSVYSDLTVEENLRYFAAIVAAPDERVDAVLREVGLDGLQRQLVGSLSGGECSRVSLASALLRRPELLVLDEPTTGLDPLLRDDLWRTFRDLAAHGTTLLVSSHQMDEAQECDRLVLMHDGRILSDSTPAELQAQTGERDLGRAFRSVIEAASP